MKLSAIEKLCKDPGPLVDMLAEKRICPDHLDGSCTNKNCKMEAQTCRDCWDELHDEPYTPHVNSKAERYAVYWETEPELSYKVKAFWPDESDPINEIKSCHAVFASYSEAMEYASYKQWRFYSFK